MIGDVFQPDAALLPLLPAEDRRRFTAGLDTGSRPDQTVLILHGADFAAYNLAKGLLTVAGFSIGQSCARQPTACMFGNYDWIAKWRNLTKTQQKQTHIILNGDHRLGPISLTLGNACPPEGRARFLDAASELKGIS